MNIKGTLLQLVIRRDFSKVMEANYLVLKTENLCVLRYNCDIAISFLFQLLISQWWNLSGGDMYFALLCDLLSERPQSLFHKSCDRPWWGRSYACAQPTITTREACRRKGVPTPVWETADAVKMLSCIAVILCFSGGIPRLKAEPNSK